ncbi:sugar ABC transporter permease [Cellulomonas hominis]|jgi:raffinose/stachyose/melibiose transport system permease protein|uniref:Raffinose/stachyose/melibiose transport system permease protein n=1 Tax=Cellulomonas hominis TaxID=156981 RepID=A0A511FDB3_9CELL|nr:sugar ABC transporter permease [Cellulomonas hominis]MBB5475294.1 raffinose/stachyose/melibiose transport system permease protein [Cellulomonas hominis]NKY07130.1 sugar ABC transporter permease [Cellulomonas hominis]GEL47221.1 sugar ABC transporter permease [Cellulomonas hominis]
MTLLRTRQEPRTDRPRRGRRHRPFLTALPYLLPAVALYGYFIAYPMLDSIRLSFYKWSGFRTETPEFVGLDNYRRLFTADPVFWKAFGNSVIWVVLSLLIPMVLGLLLALGLNRRIVGRNLMRSVIYIPAVFASITVAAMWRWIYNPTLGLVNQGLEAVGLGDWAQSWLGDPKIALYSVFAASVWQAVGFPMVLFLAGLQSVPPELVDAAKIDGAGTWQVFRNVTLPALRPTTVVVVILTIINSLKVFDLIVGMTGGGPAQSTQVLALWSYTQSFTNHSFGAGGAVATVLLVLSLCLVIPYMAWSMKGDDK